MIHRICFSGDQGFSCRLLQRSALQTLNGETLELDRPQSFHALFDLLIFNESNDHRILISLVRGPRIRVLRNFARINGFSARSPNSSNQSLRLNHSLNQSLHESDSLAMMRLLNAETHELPNETEKRQQGCPYVILSHVWQEAEMTFEDMPHFENISASPLGPKYASASKIIGACNAVLRHYKGSITHLWLDTICIDKKNLTEFSTAINSMWQWYKQADVCFAFLEDFPGSGAPTWTQSKWFTRGWTLQELVAPKNVIFFDKNWNKKGDRENLQRELTGRTKIIMDFLLHRQNISRASICQRMSWFAGGETTVPEDTAYCLLGLFGVNMPLLYGEGKEGAFRRLQEEIMRYSDDHFLFAWKTAAVRPLGSGLLAESPSFFQETGDYVHRSSRQNNRPFQVTNKGISIDLYLQQYQGVYIASVECLHGQSHYLGVFLECTSEETQQYRRIRTNELCRVVGGARGQLRSIFVKPPDDI